VSRGKQGKMAIAALAGSIVVSMAAMVAPAGATRTVNVPSSLTISVYAYFGKVKAPNPGCVSGRKVVLKQKGHGVLGRTTSNDKGSWKLDPATIHYKGALPFKVFAIVKPSSEGTAGTIYKCAGATSKTITINGG
jgi:hypothetical protein